MVFIMVAYWLLLGKNILHFYKGICFAFLFFHLEVYLKQLARKNAVLKQKRKSRALRGMNFLGEEGRKVRAPFNLIDSTILLWLSFSLYPPSPFQAEPNTLQLPFYLVVLNVYSLEFFLEQNETGLNKQANCILTITDLYLSKTQLK